MHRLALGAFSPRRRVYGTRMSFEVLMHRLALGAFSLIESPRDTEKVERGLNAPFGARCFLT